MQDYFFIKIDTELAYILSFLYVTQFFAPELKKMFNKICEKIKEKKIGFK